jgi:hypothetical protein
MDRVARAFPGPLFLVSMCACEGAKVTYMSLPGVLPAHTLDMATGMRCWGLHSLTRLDTLFWIWPHA